MLFPLNSANTIEWTLLNLSKIQRLGIAANIICVDSGSDDGTLELVRKYGFKSVYFPKGNMYAAINHGLHMGKSRWCTYINSDDILYPDVFFSSIEKAQEDNSDIIYGNLDYFDKNGCFLHSWNTSSPRDVGALFEDKINPIPQPGTIFRRKIYEQMGGFDQRFKYSADYDFFLKSYKNNAKFTKIEGMPVAAFRLHQSQISQSCLDDMRKEARESFSKITKRTSWVGRKFAKFKLRTINAPNYAIRITRYYYLNNSFTLPKCLKIP